MPQHDKRLIQLKKWLAEVLPNKPIGLFRASEDASFRRYFRVRSASGTWIAMDAPPDKESCVSFVDVDRMIRRAGLRAPRIFAHDPQQGFMLLEDLGDTLFLSRVTPANAESMYQSALQALADMQLRIDGSALPTYDGRLLMQEMRLFEHWFLGQWLALPLSASERHLLHWMFEKLTDLALTQTRCFVHRDYHSRNLLWLDDCDSPGIIDFQDAVYGPVTYDAVSLLRDCYVKWPDDLVAARLLDYYQILWDGKLIRAGFEQFSTWFDFLGIQRHLKAIGIFCRLFLRDAKPGYLKDIPRTLSYIIACCQRYEDLQVFGDYLQHSVYPRLLQKQPLA